MYIQEIVNFLVDCEYNEDTCLDVTYAALSLFKKDKDCLYEYANSYGPFITHLLEVYGKRLEYSPDKYLIYSGNAALDCGLVDISSSYRTTHKIRRFTVLNTCMRDIIVYTWRQTEYAYKVPELLRTLVGKNITPEIESKLTEMETYVDEIGRNVYIIYFRDVVETVCKAVSEMDYYYWRMRVRSIDKLIEDSVEHAEGKSTTNAMKETASAMIELLPASKYCKKDFYGGTKYTYLSNLYYLTREFAKHYEPELIYYVKDKWETILGSEICRVVDIDNCGLGRLRDTIKKRVLKRSDNIYANWVQFCKYAEVYYAYLVKYAKERNTKDIVLNVSAYKDLISNDTVSFIAANWLPNQATGDVYGTVSRIVPCSQIMSEVVDFINKRSEKVTEYDIAKNTIKVLSIGAKLTKREYQNHVVRLLRAAADWESAADTEKCAAYMLQVLNDFCAELPFSGDDCCIYRNILKEAREGLPYRYTGLRA